MPKGYWVAKANILDDEKLSRYGKQAEIAIEKFGGKFLVRGGQHAVSYTHLTLPTSAIV